MSVRKGQVALGRVEARERFSISPALFFLVSGLLLITNAVAVVGFFMSSDIAALFDDHSDEVAQSYEMRIADLKTEIDRLNSRQYAKAGDLNLQMQELVQQQEQLAEQHQYVSALARMAEDLGIETANSSDGAAPVPAPAPNVVPAAAPAGAKGTDLASIQSNITRMMTESENAIEAISTAAKQSTDTLVGGLKKIGVAPDDMSSEDAGVGGPFVGLPDDSSSPMLEKANDVVAEFRRFQQARAALKEAPVHAPLAGPLRVSSPFGERVDPFLKKRAFHAGIDLPEPTGTLVHATGAGTISYAGRSSGYGNLVEITHVNGVVSRYGHLSAILVKKGQSVETGDVIGKVGSTGRSTGPHLHFEIRRGGAPVNPEIYLSAGKTLSRFL